jgi:hypothetical protein
LSKDTFSIIAMRNPPFRPPLRAASVGAGSKPARYDVLMLLEMCIAHIFCPPMNRWELAGLDHATWSAEARVWHAPAGTTLHQRNAAEMPHPAATKT